MQAIIMAAGFGSRIAAVTNNKPKSFLVVNGERLIDRAIRILKDRGIDDITVVVGYKEDVMRSQLPKDLTLVTNPLFASTNVLASFACGMTHLKDDFVFLHADTIFDETILDDLLEDPRGFVLPVDFKSCVEEEMKVRTSSGRVCEISKKIDLSVAEGEFLGLAMIRREFLDDLRNAVNHELKNNNKHQDYFEAAIQSLIYKGREISFIPTDNRKWIEIDFPEDYERAKQMFES